jgi:hypothetical protein
MSNGLTGKDAIFLAAETGAKLKFPSATSPILLALDDQLEVPVPEGFDRNDAGAARRWSLAFARTASAALIYLKDRANGVTAEIAIDAAGERPRLEITAFNSDDIAETESQLLISIGASGVAAFPAAKIEGEPILFTDEGRTMLEPMRREDFLAKDKALDFPVRPES